VGGIKVLKMQVENLGDNRSYVVLYTKYAYTYASVTDPVHYLWYYV